MGRRKLETNIFSLLFHLECKIGDSAAVSSGLRPWFGRGYIKRLIEHKIIRARTGARCDDFIRPRKGERFKAGFFSRTSSRGFEPRQGNNYRSHVTLIRKSCYLAILFCSCGLATTTLSYEDKLHPWPDRRHGATQLPYIYIYISLDLNDICWNCTSRRVASVPKFRHFRFFSEEEKLPSRTFNPPTSRSIVDNTTARRKSRDLARVSRSRETPSRLDASLYTLERKKNRR